MSKKIERLSDLRPDATNANKGTQRGRGMDDEVATEPVLIFRKPGQ
jgi:hypothetical protein